MILYKMYFFCVNQKSKMATKGKRKYNLTRYRGKTFSNMFSYITERLQTKLFKPQEFICFTLDFDQKLKMATSAGKIFNMTQ